MHSESPPDHEAAMNLIAYANSNTPELKNVWDSLEKFELGHKEVVDKFGRYPHRNKAHGRQSTPEEQAWLADVDNLPGWAKTQ
jgi:uncharacterized protein (DUF924 family)